MRIREKNLHEIEEDYVEAYLNLKREFVILLSNNRYFKVFNRRALGW